MARLSFATVLLLCLFGLLVSVAAVPITPSAADAERLAERMRADGVSERDIAAHLSALRPSPEPGLLFLDDSDEGHESPSRLQIFFSFPFSKVHYSSASASASRKASRDTSGDLSPGSLEAPSMLPRTVNLHSKRPGLIAGMFARRKNKMEPDFAYEGMEGRVRRPVGMRQWAYGSRGYQFV